MQPNSGRVILACCVLCGVVGGLAFLAFRPDTEAQSEEPPPPTSTLPEIGRFRVGAALGRERAGFCGNPMLQVFTHAGDPNLAAIQACLASIDVAGELDLFTGLPDPDAHVERRADRKWRLGGHEDTPGREVLHHALADLAARFEIHVERERYAHGFAALLVFLVDAWLEMAVQCALELLPARHLGR